MSKEIHSGKENSGNISIIPPSVNQKSFIDFIPLPAYIKSADNILINCNELFAQLLNTGNVSSLLNKPLNELIHSFHTQADNYYEGLLIKEGTPVGYEHIFLDSAGKEHLISIHKSLIHHCPGSAPDILGIITSDIPESDKASAHRSADELIALFNERTRELEQSNQALQLQLEQLNATWVEVRKTEQRVETALTALKAGAWEWLPKTNHLEWSKKCFEIFGLSAQDISPEKWLSQVYPSDLERVGLMWNRLPNQYGWFEFEFRILKKNVITWIRMAGQYLVDESGIEKVLGVMIDITDEKFFHERLFDRQEFLKGIIEDQTEIICRMKPSGKISFFNQAFSRFFQIPQAELINQTFSSLLNPPEYAKIKRLFNLVKPGNPVLNFEQAIEKADGEKAIVQWTIRAFFDAENVLREYQLVGRDITAIEASRAALHKSGEMFRLFTENSTDIISLHNQTTGNVEYVSPSISKILGYDVSEITGNNAYDLVYTGDYEVLKQITEHFNHSSDALCIEIRLLDTANQVIWFEIVIQPQVDQDNITTGNLIAVSRNINSRKQIEQQRLQAETELLEANAAKDKFFSIIAHDLRSPFTAILGFSRLLDDEYDDFDDAERKLMIKQVLMATENTFQLLDNLLIWAKAQLKHTNFFPENFQIIALIKETLSLNWPQAQAKEVDFLIRSADDFMVSADINMIKTVLRNLFSNAIKYSYSKSTIELDITASEGMINITITDHGTGMEEETLKALFNLDQKVTSIKGTANEKGTGLGLILAKEFVEKNNGKISVMSEPGQGSQFSFTLPLASGS
ncbi:MAG: PAS domain S-box protein [Lentimicrobiaceae bacterium]|jgi:PAS domain S-box-containing protein|nr:PAS domain S-box protein [Lentimicrobiaceae bacterium]